MANSGKTRVTAVVLAVVLLAVILLSSLFVVQHANHQCVGSGCCVCCLIDASLTHLKMLSLALLAAVSAPRCLHIRRNPAAGHAVAAALCTPVSLKVKLTD